MNSVGFHQHLPHLEKEHDLGHVTGGVGWGGKGNVEISSEPGKERCGGSFKGD